MQNTSSFLSELFGRGLNWRQVAVRLGVTTLIVFGVLWLFFIQSFGGGSDISNAIIDVLFYPALTSISVVSNLLTVFLSGPLGWESGLGLIVPVILWIYVYFLLIFVVRFSARTRKDWAVFGSILILWIVVPTIALKPSYDFYSNQDDAYDKVVAEREGQEIADKAVLDTSIDSKENSEIKNPKAIDALPENDRAIEDTASSKVKVEKENQFQTGGIVLTTYKDPQGKFEIQYPKAWGVRVNKDPFAVSCDVPKEIPSAVSLGLPQRVLQQK